MRLHLRREVFVRFRFRVGFHLRESERFIAEDRHIPAKGPRIIRRGEDRSFGKVGHIRIVPYLLDKGSEELFV